MKNKMIVDTDKSKIKAYNGTTKSAKPTTKNKKPKRRDKSDLGADFVAPDGGWGWVVCVAAGLSNFSIFPPLQLYGIIYRKRLESLHFNGKQITTVVNIVIAISSLLGLINGAMFRRFTFRQVAITGGFLVFVGIFTSAFCQSFVQFIISFSCTYGLGSGLCTAATSLVVNTYFKLKRRRATGFTWTISGMGYMIFPYISTILMANYGVQGSILIFAAISLNAIACGCTFQPVLWHVKTTADEAGTKDMEKLAETVNVETFIECNFCRYQKQNETKTTFYSDDDPERATCVFAEPLTPILARANDEWFGSKTSLASEISIGYPENEKSCKDLSKAEQNLCCTCAEERALLPTLTHVELLDEAKKSKTTEVNEVEAERKATFTQKIIKFFDLDLLKDFTFVNLSLGITIMMFGEVNFSILTPFILNSYGYTEEQVSLAMAILGGTDIATRFLAPLALEKVKLDNRVLFVFGIIVLSIARFIVTITDSYHLMLAVFVLIGFSKAFRKIFSPLIIPSYVPLKRLPAASGLQLICNSIFTFIFGPILGSITDAFNFTVTIHFINLLTAIALSLWIAEILIRRCLNKPPIALIY